jgi:hypothetical protein
MVIFHLFYPDYFVQFVGLVSQPEVDPVELIYLFFMNLNLRKVNQKIMVFYLFSVLLFVGYLLEIVHYFVNYSEIHLELVIETAVFVEFDFVQLLVVLVVVSDSEFDLVVELEFVVFKNYLLNLFYLTVI